MAKIRLTSPTFDASAKTITHASFSDVTLAGIQLIVNVTDQIIIYNFADTAKGGSLTGDVLTLEYDTTTMSDTDELMVLVEDGVAYQLPTGAATAANQASILAAVDGLEALLTTIDADTGAILAAVDTLETLVAATNTKLDTVIGHVDGIETLVTASNTKLDTLITQTDAVEAVLATIDADTGVLAATVQTQDAAYTPGGLQMAGGVRHDADTTPITADGDVHPFLFDETGRLKTSSYPPSLTVYTDNITSNGDTVSLDVSRYSNLTIYCTGTFSTVNVTFEGSIDNGTTWFGVQAVRSNANTVETTTGNLSAAPAYAWELSVNALTNFRVRATAYTSGTQVWRFAPGTYATEPIPGVQSHAVTLTSTTITSLIPTTAATALGKARDSAIGATDTGVANLMVRRDTPTAETPAAGDYVVPQVSAFGEQWVRLAGELADDAAFTVATTRILPVGFLADETATDSVDEGDAGIARMTLDRKQIHANYAHTAGGATPYKLVSAATTNATSVKASAGQVYMITASNVNAAVRYLKLYNKASAPTVGTDVPVLTLAIPGNTAGAGTNIPVPTVGLSFSTGIAFALTTEATDAGTTAVAANEIVVNLAYL